MHSVQNLAHKIDIYHLDTPMLQQISQRFFSAYGSASLLGDAFVSALKKKPDQNLFDAVMENCGYQNDADGFFFRLFSQIIPPGANKTPVQINTVELPNLYLYHLLDAVLPGNRLYQVKTAEQLEQITGMPSQSPADLQQVIDCFPVRLSDHVIRQSLVSKAVANQYLPFVRELDDTGRDITFDGHFKNGILEQMYENRVIFLLDMQCPVYCRFCFRKHKAARKQNTPSSRDVLAAVEHVRSHQAIHEVLITGGEPLWNRANLETAINGLMDIDHVNTIRIATRSIVYYPELFLKNKSDYVRYLVEKNQQCLDRGQRIEMGIHVVHPDELSIQSLDLVSCFVKNGIQVYVQTPFLGGINNSGQALARLFTLLRQAGAQIYYIFAPCSPIHGTKAYWSSIDQAVEAYQFLRRTVSDRCLPKLCTATPLGKIEWHTSGWAVEKDANDDAYTWIRTPYTLSYFKQFIRESGQIPAFRINSEGTLDARFQLDMGRSALYTGSGRRPPEKQEILTPLPVTAEAVFSSLYQRSALRPSVLPVPHAGISRVHQTCLEIQPEKGAGWFDYLGTAPEISDVIIHWDGDDPALAMDQISQVVQALHRFSHVVCVRLKSNALACCPERFTPAVIQAISLWQDVSLADPFRIEMETWFLLPDQISSAHCTAVKAFLNKGVNVYANVPLICGMNDRPDTMAQLAYELRKAKVEFHHLYVGGLDIQHRYGSRPDADRIIDIAGRVRQKCSGRQIPLYMVQTSDGDIDFGLDPSYLPFSPYR